MAISTNPKHMIYRSLYKNTVPAARHRRENNEKINTHIGQNEHGMGQRRWANITTTLIQRLVNNMCVG